MNQTFVGVCVVVLGWLVGCGGANDEAAQAGADSSGAIEEPFEPPDENVLIGQVIGPGGAPVVFARISIDGGSEAWTNANGYYYLEGVDLGEETVVQFSAPGYSAILKKALVNTGSTSTLNALLLPHVEARSVDHQAGGVASFGRGSLALGAGVLVDSNGEAVAGAVNVRMTIIDVKSDEILASPGDFSARDATGGAVQLETFGLADISIDSDGENVQLKEGETADLEMLLPPDTTLEEGDQVPLWYFDETDGKWAEEGIGTVQEYSGDPARLAVAGPVSHFSWWNADYPMEVTCINGVVTTCDGVPAPGAFVLARGISYDGTASAHTDQDGRFCVPVMTGSNVRFEASYGWGQDTLLTIDEVVAPSEPGTCDQGESCLAKDLTLPCDPSENELDCADSYFIPCQGCLEGKVVDIDRIPVGSAEVTVKTGNTMYKKYTDSNGEFCTPAALSGAVTISAYKAGQSAKPVVVEDVGKGKCPDCEVAPTLVLDGSVSPDDDDGIDLCECHDLKGSIKVDKIIAENADPSFYALTAGFGSLHKLKVDDPGDDEELKWSMDLVFYPSCQTSANDLPYARLSMYHHGVDLPMDAPLNESVELLDMYGEAVSRLNLPLYMGKQVLQLNRGEPDEPGPASQVTITGGTLAPGSMVEGTFDLSYRAECAPVGSKVRLVGTFELPVSGGGVDIYDTTEEFMKSFECESTSFELGIERGVQEAQTNGSVQMEIDDVPVGYSEEDALSAVYWPEYDELRINVQTGQVTFQAEVEAPVSGENVVDSGLLMLSGEPDCLDTLESGTVVLDGSPGDTSDYALSGSFDISFKALGAPGDGGCPDHQVQGYFLAPTCGY